MLSYLVKVLVANTWRPKAVSPTQHISAWTEIGVVIVAEISMIKPDLFDILDKWLQKLKSLASW